jgi:hypothetical protein
VPTTPSLTSEGLSYSEAGWQTQVTIHLGTFSAPRVLPYPAVHLDPPLVPLWFAHSGHGMSVMSAIISYYSLRCSRYCRSTYVQRPTSAMSSPASTTINQWEATPSVGTSGPAAHSWTSTTPKNLFSPAMQMTPVQEDHGIKQWSFSVSSCLLVKRDTYAETGF